MGGPTPQRGTPAWNILMQPRCSGRAAGRVRAGIEAIQADLLQQLRFLDAEVDRLARQREQIVADLRRCTDAFGAYPTRPRRRAETPQLVDAQPEGTRPLTGSALRGVLVDILRSAERPLAVEALHRALLLRGLNVEGRPSKAIPDALRTAVKRGDARRLRPGVYLGARQTQVLGRTP